MVDSITFSSITDLAPRLAAREISSVEVTRLMLERIGDVGTRLNCFITVLPDDALRAAEAADIATLRGDYRGPLHGVPVAVKDLFATAGVRTTFGSLRFADWVPDYDASVVRRLRESGAVIVGKTNLDEAAMGTTSVNPHFGAVRNPWRLDYHPGGSSGGSAVAVAADLAYLSLGSDTGASVRQPAASCGIVGMKPTYGRVSKHGCLPLAWSMDHVGLLNKTVADAALTLNLLAGYDPSDPSSVDRSVPDFAADIDVGVEGMRIGLVRSLFMEDGDKEVMNAVEAAAAQFEALGAVVEEIAIPDAATLTAIGSLTISVEAAAYHAPHLDERPDDYSPQVRPLLELGQLYKATDYVQAQRVRRALMDRFAQAMAPFDVLILPTCPITATTPNKRPPGEVFLRIRNTIAFNVLGLPCISLPCGFSLDGVPIGLQIVGEVWSEAKIIRAGHAYEQATEWHTRHATMDGAA